MISSLSALVSLWFFLLLLQHSASDPVVYPSKSKLLSWKPSIIVRGGAFVDEGFLTEEECDHLISLARSELKRSAVADNLSGKNTLSEVRTSSGMFISKGKDPIISGIEDKIAAWTFLPKENGEDIQVLRYEHGQKYDPHFDYFSDEVNIARGSHRITTVLIYLSDVTKGGETVFPSAQIPYLSVWFTKVLSFACSNFYFAPRSCHTAAKDDDSSECGRRGVAVKPKRGDALLFFSLHPDATTDPLSLHAGCPVMEGEKWSATKWIHVAFFDKIITSQGNCTDEKDNCGRWTALGECTKNPEYMVGTSGLPGFCRRSCNVC